MKKLSALFTFLLFCALNMTAQTWNFATLNNDDKTNLNADATNWSYDSTNDRWLQQATLNDEVLKANGVELSFTKDLTFTTTDKDQIRVDNKKHSLTINNKKAKVKIHGVKAGQVLTIESQSSSSTTARKIEATNITVTKGFEESTSKVTNEGTVVADGDIELTTTGGMYVFSIQVTDGDGSETVDPQPGDDYSVPANSQKNQAVISLNTNERKYYNTETLESIDFSDGNVTMNLGTNKQYTFAGNVAGISFKKAEIPGGDVDNPEGAVEIIECRGWLESAYIKFKKYEGAKTYNVYVKGGQFADYTKLDAQLVRDYGSYGRADAVGLRAGNYSIKIVAVNSEGSEIAGSANEANNMEVKNYSREGFAFMNGYVPGAYQADGTLKPGAKVLYVTKNTAKTISTNVAGATTNPCVGFQAIIAAYEKGQDTTPIAFRFIGLIEKDDLDAIGSSEEGIQVKGRKADSEMNLTFEGIGDDATLKGFGFLIRNSKSLEFRNFAIMRCMDDCLSLDTDNSNIWIHHTDQFYGKHGSGDHAKGDGATDVKSDSKYVTVSYNRYWDTGKTNMFGMKSESGPNFISYDHNWFDHSDSRHPRVRTMTVHVWNNYFDNVAKYGVGATTGASVFVENNYFLKTKKPILSSLQGTDGLGSGTFSGENGGMIKAYGNYFDRTAAHFSYYTQKNPSSKGYDAYETSTRDEQVPATETTLVGGTNYNNFDTNVSLMYEYNAVAADEVPALVTGYYGAGRLNHGDFTYTFSDNVGIDDDDSAYDTVLGGLLDNYKSSLVGIFGDENSTTPGGDEPSGGEPGGDESASTGTITASFDAAPSHSMFTVAGDYGDGKITYNGTYYKKGVKLNSKGSVTFTPANDYKMTIVLATAKTGRTVKVNNVETAGGTENTEGSYYVVTSQNITKGTQYVIKQGSGESILMLIILESIE